MVETGHISGQERQVYTNGQFIPESVAGVGIYDAALATGQKMLEVSRTFNHQPYKLDEHLDRLYKGLELLRIDPGLTQNEMKDATFETLSRNLPTQPATVDWQVIHYVSPGPASVFEMHDQARADATMLIHCIPLVNRLGKRADKYINGIDLVVVEQRALPQNIIPGYIKSNGRLDHMMARLQAGEIQKGATGVLLDQDGIVTEATGASLFMVKDEVIRTAPTDKVLSGITREMVFDLAREAGVPVEEANLDVANAAESDEMFVTSTIICLDHARSFNGQAFGDNGRIGPVTQVIRAAMIDELQLDFVEQAQNYKNMLEAHGPIR